MKKAVVIEKWLKSLLKLKELQISNQKSKIFNDVESVYLKSLYQ